MDISNEIKSLLELKGRKKSELQKHLGLKHPQALTTKFARDSWSAEDLIKVVTFLGGELIIRIDGREIKLDEKYIKSSQSKID